MQKDFNKPPINRGLLYAMTNRSFSTDLIKLKRDLRTSASSAHTNTHNRSRRQNPQTNRLCYQQTKPDQTVYPLTHHAYDDSWKSGRKHIQERNNLGREIVKQTALFEHAEPYRHSDLDIPNNRKRMNYRMENLKLRNPIFEQPLVRPRTPSTECRPIDRKLRDNGENTRQSLIWRT